MLVVDAAAMARSVAAIVHGYRTFDPDVNVAGVILNRVGSEAHADLLREALPGIPRARRAARATPTLEVPERHLGLVPVAERAPRAQRGDRAPRRRASRRTATSRRSLALARSRARARPATRLGRPDASDAGTTARVAIARGPAFSFHYEENLELLRGAGAELVAFDPLTDERCRRPTR